MKIMDILVNAISEYHADGYVKYYGGNDKCFCVGEEIRKCKTCDTEKCKLFRYVLCAGKREMREVN